MSKKHLKIAQNCRNCGSWVNVRQIRSAQHAYLEVSWMRTAILSMLLLLLFAGCTSGLGIRPVATPVASQISRITITRENIPGGDNPPPTVPVIEDRDQIVRIAEFLAAHSRGWREPCDTFPIPRYNIVLESPQGSPFYLWDGGGWIGGPVEGGNRLRSMSEAEMREFRNLLSIPQIR